MPTYQSSAAEQDHEDDEGFKPVVLHYDEAGFPEVPPPLVVSTFLVDLAQLESAHTTCRETGATPKNQLVLHAVCDHTVLTKY